MSDTHGDRRRFDRRQWARRVSDAFQSMAIEEKMERYDELLLSKMPGADRRMYGRRFGTDRREGG